MRVALPTEGMEVDIRVRDDHCRTQITGAPFLFVESTTLLFLCFLDGNGLVAEFHLSFFYSISYRLTMFGFHSQFELNLCCLCLVG